MALVVETGAGLSNANSYVSVEFANSYVADFASSSTWSAAESSRKESLLRLATQFLDLNYRYKGYRTSLTQALAWPRSSASDYNDRYGGISTDDNQYISSDEIPLCVKQATVEAALRFLAGDDPLAAIADPGSVKRQFVKIGQIEEEMEYAGGKGQSPLYPKIKKLLAGLTKSSTLCERG